MNEPKGAAVPVVFLDTETTSLDPRSRRAWDVAMIRREPDGSEQTHCYFVEDVDLADANPFSLRVGHFYERHPNYMEGRRLDTPYMSYEEIHVARMVERITRGAHLVGAVPSFDTETLAGMLWRNGFVPAWHHHLIDVENLVAGYLGVPPPYDSRELSLAVGVDRMTYREHTAYGDALWARDLYDAVMYEAERENEALRPFNGGLTLAEAGAVKLGESRRLPRPNKPVPYAVTDAGFAALAGPHSTDAGEKADGE